MLMWCGWRQQTGHGPGVSSVTWAQQAQVVLQLPAAVAIAVLVFDRLTACVVVLLQDMLVKQIEGHTICALGDAGECCD